MNGVICRRRASRIGPVIVWSIVACAIMVVFPAGPTIASDAKAGTANPQVTSTGSSTQMSVPAGYAYTPFGLWPRDCIHNVPNHSQVTTDGYFVPSGAFTAFASCRGGPLPQAASWTWYVHGGWYYHPQPPPAIAELSASWTVPTRPSNQNANPLIYLFDGLEPNLPSLQPLLIQPVLAYGNSGAIGSGATWWSIADWVYSTAYGVLAVSPAAQVSSGDTISGVMAGGVAGNPPCNKSTGVCDWIITASDLTNGASEYLTCTSYKGLIGNSNLCGYSMEWAAVVLEAAYIQNCQSFPASGSTTFNDIYISGTSGGIGGAPGFVGAVDNSMCNDGVNILPISYYNGNWVANVQLVY